MGKRTGLDALTARQMEILRLIARHQKIKEVGRALEISPWTVRDHIVEVRQKLQVKTTREAVLMLLDDERTHLKTPPSPEGPLPQGAGDVDDLPSTSGHGQHTRLSANPESSADTRVRGELGGPEIGMAEDGFDGKVEGRRRHGRDLPPDEREGGREHHLHHRGGDGLADGRIADEAAPVRRGWHRHLAVVQAWLQTARPSELVMFAGAVTLATVLIVGGVIVGVIGTLESLQAFFHHPAP